MLDFNYHTEVLDLVKALWGLKDAPRAFGLKLAETLREAGYVQGMIDPQVWRKFKPGCKSREKEAIISMEDPSKPSDVGGKRIHNVGEDILGTNVECMLTTHIDDIKGPGAKHA